MTLQTQRVQSLEQVCAFLEGNEAVDFVEGDREGVYDLVRRTLVKLRYHRLGKPGKGLVKRYLGKVTGLSRAQHTRPSAVRIGVRRRPTPRGRPGYLRVDTVQAISEAFLIPVLESLIGAFPFEVNAFNRDWLSPFLNYHRPCLFPTEVVDGKGRVRKRYRDEDVMTPYEKLKSLHEAEKHLRPGVTFKALDEQARATSELQAAKALNRARADLFAFIDEHDNAAA